MTLTDGCAAQVLSPVPQTVSYTNDYTSATTFTVSPLGTTITQCQVSFQCAMISTTTVDLCNYSDALTTTSFDPVTGVFSFDSDDYFTYGSQTLIFEITATSGNDAEAFLFDIILQSPCDSATIVPKAQT